ncbi:LacI family DNA-binding transcriptional regulator [Hufsiella ginkgonis]|uniref:Substrate-binding domain-containing protein n=1 Tax=Hufsiella ginkgonis TaxID=2695274 RepID=A0A7K1XVH5_9SPHI|nr:LacI family DNA-binding transcriptional regulator [Hufsiella ginkgonis]MXV14980.1 substrate-binding domain-containing protein [Hufsiella ginkgonis]
MEKVDIKRLARELNLSISTVSRALRDSHEISDSTKKKVFELARQLNYQPNPHASSLREQRTKTIALIIPEVANNFFSLVIDGIESIAAEKGFHVLIYLTHEKTEKEVEFVRQLSNGRVDGILMSVSGLGQSITHLEDLMQKNIPLVFFDRTPDELDVPKIITDDRDSSFRATEHLIQCGCKKIVHVSILRQMSISDKRKQGYLDAINKHGLPEMVLDCSIDEEETYQLIKTCIREQKPDALFASLERLAIAAYYVCGELGLNIPGDLKVLSFSNLQTASLLNPPLTTVTQSAFDMGAAATKQLFRLIKGQEIDERTITIRADLIRRKSTSCD